MQRKKEKKRKEKDKESIRLGNLIDHLVSRGGP